MTKIWPLGVALFLIACGPKAQAPDGVGAPGAPIPPANVEGPARHYDAISKTAMAFTGGLEIHDVSPVGPNATPGLKIASETGLVFEANLIETQRGAGKVGITNWAALMPIPEDADVAVESVAREEIGAKAPNGGLCAPAKTSVLALATYKEDDGATMMQIAAFSDAVWPPKKTPTLCGAFTYQLKPAPAAPQ